ncbi:tetratricopeptide repeat protein [Shimia biformata]|uniref:tetratricopeptide repeat protein n=1 Tax=Shimia biformata TaxID=1294299 RepID=UPI0019529DBE|nr:tetratricopeptide repeat protein [Shimia biformata]
MRSRLLPTLFLALVLLPGFGAAQETGQNTGQHQGRPADPAALTDRAEAGDVAAMTALAFLYHGGQEVLQDFTAAATWATRAGEAGDPRAQNLLGQYYHTGLGVPRDSDQALRWLGMAAESGDPQFLFDYGAALEQSADRTAEAATVYARAAEAGHVDAAVSLGVLYQEGRGVETDYARALALYEGAAARGHARALNNLGLLYVRGHGVAQDYQKAASLFAAAAEQGLDQALTNLGVMYENGFGVELDEARAAALYREAKRGAEGPGLRYDPRLMPPPEDPALQQALLRAAEAGDPVAAFQSGWLLTGTPGASTVDLSRAARLFHAAARAGHGPSMINLALLYFDGRGVPQDYVLGQMWLILASAAQMPDALTLSRHFHARMTPGQITEAQERAQERALVGGAPQEQPGTPRPRAGDR